MAIEQSNIPEMNIKEATKYFIANANLQIEGKDMAIPYIVGAPGIGKTRFLEYEAKRLGFGFVSFHFSLIPIEEIGGLPIFKEIDNNSNKISGTEWSLPDIMTKIYEMANTHKKVIIFLDDFHMSSPAHLALGYEMFTEKKLRSYTFPANTAFLLAGNDTMKSGAKQMFGAIVNRLAIYKVIPEFEQWMGEYAIPHRINPKIISFLNNKVNASYFLGEECTNEPWPSPRSWSRLSEILNMMEEYIPNLNPREVLYNAYGHVGNKASAEFGIYYDIYSKTNIGEVFDEKKKIEIPKNNTDMYIYGMAASNEYVNRIIDLKSKSEILPVSKINNIKNNNIKIISQIITGIGKTAIEISVSLLKNISDYETALGMSGTREKLYIQDILKEIRNQDEEIDKKITSSITDILMALS